MLGNRIAVIEFPQGYFETLSAENSGFLMGFSGKVAELLSAIGVGGVNVGLVRIALMALAISLIVLVLTQISEKISKRLSRKSPEKLAGILVNNHVAFVGKFVDEMQLALTAGPTDSGSGEGPMKFLMDESESAWEQVAQLGQDNPAVERALSSYLNSLKRLSVMERAVLTRTDITSLDTSDFEFQHPIAEAAAGLRVLSRALGRTGATKKDRLARYELTALSEDAEVIWDELKARADGDDLMPDIILRSQSEEVIEVPQADLDDTPVPHLQTDDSREVRSHGDTSISEPKISLSEDRPVSGKPSKGVVESGALSGYEIVD